MERERLIIGLSTKEQLIHQIEAHMRPGELVMAEKYHNEVHVARMTTCKLEGELMLSPGPTYIIDGGGYFPRPLSWTKKGISLKNYISELSDKVKTERAIAVGNDSVFEFFARYCQHYSALESQKALLRVINHSGIVKSGRFLGEIQLKVAQGLAEQLVSQLLDKPEFPSVQVLDPNILGNIVYCTERVTKESIQEFIALLNANRRNTEISIALKDLVDTGLYGLGLKVIIEGDEKRPQTIDIDEIFNYLAHYYHPSLTPSEIPRKRWEQD